MCDLRRESLDSEVLRVLYELGAMSAILQRAGKTETHIEYPLLKRTEIKRVCAGKSPGYRDVDTDPLLALSFMRMYANDRMADDILEEERLLSGMRLRLDLRDLETIRSAVEQSLSPRGPDGERGDGRVLSSVDLVDTRRLPR